MPMTECETHGMTGSAEMCEHLKEHLDRGIYRDFVTLPIYTIRICAGCVERHDVAAILDSVLVDRAEADALRATETGVRSIGPDYLFESAVLERDHPDVLAKIVAIYDALNENSGFQCVGCIDRVQLDHARATGIELPFEPFENTILHSEDPRVDRLRNLVLDHMDPRGNHGNQFYGCTIFAGSVRRPLLLKIYGVPTEEQPEMLSLINRFFEDVSTSERCVQFFEPIRWRVHENGKTREPDVMLDEVTLGRLRYPER